MVLMTTTIIITWLLHIHLNCQLNPTSTTTTGYPSLKKLTDPSQDPIEILQVSRQIQEEGWKTLLKDYHHKYLMIDFDASFSTWLVFLSWNNLCLSPVCLDCSGCSYKGRKYSHSEEVLTSQPCLNCTCQRGFVSCFLRVCPQLEPPENDDSCYLLKEPGSCCQTLKCSGFNEAEVKPASSSSSSPSSLSHTYSTSTQTSVGNSNKSFGWNGGNGLERKAETVYRRPTSIRPPYNDYWSSSRKASTTKSPSTIRPYLRATSRPTPRTAVSSKPVTNNRNFPLKPTFPPRRPMYPSSSSSGIGSGPTNNYNQRRQTTASTTTKRPVILTTISRRNPIPSIHSSITSSLTSHHHHSSNKDTPVREDPAMNVMNEHDSDNFFRMSHLLVWSSFFSKICFV